MTMPPLILHMLKIKNIPHYLALMRIDRPIGTFLLLWPTLWALWTASQGIPDIPLFIIFVLGVFVMRSAGCIINDIADREFDPFVERTKTRPLAQKSIQIQEAVSLLLLQLVLAFGLALTLKFNTILLTIPALLIVLSYPYMKRFHPLPQAHLGVAFSFGIPMAYMEINNTVPAEAYLLMLINIIWVISYDTEYAMSDRDDDRKLNIHSTALLFERWLGSKDYYIVAILHTMVILLLYFFGRMKEFSLFWWISLCITAMLFVYQLCLIKGHEREKCFRAFLNNNWIGFIIFISLLLTYINN